MWIYLKLCKKKKKCGNFLEQPSYKGKNEGWGRIQWNQVSGFFPCSSLVSLAEPFTVLFRITLDINSFKSRARISNTYTSTAISTVSHYRLGSRAEVSLHLECRSRQKKVTLLAGEDCGNCELPLKCHLVVRLRNHFSFLDVNPMKSKFIIWLLTLKHVI